MTLTCPTFFFGGQFVLEFRLGQAGLSMRNGFSQINMACLAVRGSGKVNGVSRLHGEDLTIGVAYEHLDLGETEIDQTGGPLQGSLKGDYDPN